MVFKPPVLSNLYCPCSPYPTSYICDIWVFLSGQDYKKTNVVLSGQD
nr:MAG TPA: hypothetical protein [Caudoviricetes sp.]